MIRRRSTTAATRAILTLTRVVRRVDALRALSRRAIVPRAANTSSARIALTVLMRRNACRRAVRPHAAREAVILITPIIVGIFTIVSVTSPAHTRMRRRSTLNPAAQLRAAARATTARATRARATSTGITSLTATRAQVAHSLRPATIAEYILNRIVKDAVDVTNVVKNVRSINAGDASVAVKNRDISHIYPILCECFG